MHNRIIPAACNICYFCILTLCCKWYAMLLNMYANYTDVKELIYSMCMSTNFYMLQQTMKATHEILTVHCISMHSFQC
ncbi:hypothetical protein EB796_024228 [Bugula neritina]|uniref:Uncharacterized protein n=1 Tax=Bugula neritina TaxID=10212 RepID=A0A7J7IU61_BUGNE|nr:hypothetical protein EB796_024228 [Bugula neritina]